MPNEKPHEDHPEEVEEIDVTEIVERIAKLELASLSTADRFGKIEARVADLERAVTELIEYHNADSPLADRSAP